MLFRSGDTGSDLRFAPLEGAVVVLQLGCYWLLLREDNVLGSIMTLHGGREGLEGIGTNTFIASEHEQLETINLHRTFGELNDVIVVQSSIDRCLGVENLDVRLRWSDNVKPGGCCYWRLGLARECCLDRSLGWQLVRSEDVNPVNAGWSQVRDGSQAHLLLIDRSLWRLAWCSVVLDILWVNFLWWILGTKRFFL